MFNFMRLTLFLTLVEYRFAIYVTEVYGAM